MLPEAFFALFSQLFCTCLRIIFRTVFVEEFSRVPFKQLSNIFVQACVLPKGLS